MARRLYLHIGTMKSATSYIQALFELNIDQLGGTGVRWLPGDLRYPAIRELFGRTVQQTDVPGAWRSLAREVRQQSGDVILSNELLAPINARHIKRLLTALPPAEQHVVITARDLVRVMPSHWQTTLKNGKTQTWSEFASAVCADGPFSEDRSSAAHTHEWFWLRHDVAAMIARWQQFVPVERITLVTVPPSRSDPQTVGRRFGSVVGVDVRPLVQPEVWSNPSLGAHSAELMRRLNEQMSETEIAERRFGFRLAFGGAAVATRADVEPPFGLSREQQAWVRERAEAMVAQIELSGVRVVGDLADLVPASRDGADPVDPSDTSEAELLHAASQALLGMAKVTSELRTETHDLTAQLTALGIRRDTLERRVKRLEARSDGLSAQLDADHHSGQPKLGRGWSRLRRSRVIRGLANRIGR